MFSEVSAVRRKGFCPKKNYARETAPRGPPGAGFPVSAKVNHPKRIERLASIAAEAHRPKDARAG